MNISKKNHQVVAKYLVDKFIEKVSGSGEENIKIHFAPQNNIMVGMLAANRMRKSLVEDNKYVENKETMFKSIPAIIVNFILDNADSGELIIQPKGFLYYRVVTTYEEEIEELLRNYSISEGISFENIEQLEKHLIDNEKATKVPIYPTYKRLALEDFIREVNVKIEYLKQNKTIALSNYTKELKNAFDAIKRKIISESIIINDDIKLDISELKDKNKFAEQYNDIYSNKVIPTWGIDILLELAEINNKYKIKCTYINTADEITDSRKSSTYSPHIFNAKINIKGKDVHFSNIDLDYFNMNYKENPKIKAIGENVSVEFNETANTIETVNIPVYVQKRLLTSDKYIEYTKFKKLIDDPIKNLEYIYNDMLTDYNNVYNEYRQAVETKKYTKNSLEQYEEEIFWYDKEIKRFKQGIELIKSKELVSRAFKYMNEAFMQKLGTQSNNIDGWRLFQIVFIVSLLNDLVYSEYKQNLLCEPQINMTDILYFPTGGGKTEAFLGCMVFTIFFDRIRGKNDGVSAFVKYPLRLLSIQQFERILKMIIKVQLVIENHKELIDITPVTLGYYVGKSNTKNIIKSSDYQSILNMNQDEINKAYGLIDTCPYCGEKAVNLIFNREKWLCEHICKNCSCKLPIYIVDDEIYRFLPTVIVSTIDKLSTIGFQSDFKNLLGEVKYKCINHGYTSANKCKIEGCTCHLEQVNSLYDPVPTLSIQDELHLVNESLGIFDSHYETFFKYYTENLVKNTKKIKYIGATATISNYREHIRNLYCENAIIFPTPYPNTKRNFYSYLDENDINRLILGFAPYGRSIIDGVWETVTYFREVLYFIVKNIETSLETLKKLGFDGDINELKNVLYDYFIAIEYNTSKNDAANLNNAFQNQANNRLIQKNIPNFDIVSMTGDQTFRDVMNTLFNIQNADNYENTHNLILATKTISHGVDEDSFNQIYFYGMPSNTAEYIQSYSRVGRKYTGIVIDIIRLARERDKSYLKNFNLFHDYKDYLVDAVPINRWAKNAIYYTLPGLFAALIYQYYSSKLGNEIYKMNVLKKMFISKQIDPEDIKIHLKKAYCCTEMDRATNTYSQIIDEEVDKIIQGIVNGINLQSLSDTIKQYDTMNTSPMDSLRDTDNTLEIKRKS